ncbi:hypothetical protein BU17DRAFT_97847 [Hysterangium stoloniferum]|nr:hypothetical protein BU17DRAFT_97847 [Hysterangium stoloniferum]
MTSPSDHHRHSAVAHYDVPLPPQPFPHASVVAGPSDDPFVAAPQPLQLPPQGVIPPAPQVGSSAMAALWDQYANLPPLPPLQQGCQAANVPVQPQAPNAQLAPADQSIQPTVGSATVAAFPPLRQPAEWHHAQANAAAQIQNHPPL